MGRKRRETARERPLNVPSREISDRVASSRRTMYAARTGGGNETFLKPGRPSGANVVVDTSVRRSQVKMSII